MVRKRKLCFVGSSPEAEPLASASSIHRSVDGQRHLGIVYPRVTSLQRIFTAGPRPIVEPSAETNMVGGHDPHAVGAKFAAANGTAAATAGSTWMLEVRCEQRGPVCQQVHALTGMPALHCPAMRLAFNAEQIS